MCRSLHEATPLVPQLIRDYIAEMKFHLEHLTRQPELLLDEKLHFLRETRHTFGRTALVLSGGGSLGVFHLVRITPSVVISSSEQAALELLLFMQASPMHASAF